MSSIQDVTSTFQAASVDVSAGISNSNPTGIFDSAVPTITPTSIPGEGISMPGVSTEFTYEDLKNNVQSFFDSYFCNKESGLSPTMCGGASMWAGGAKTLLDVASGMFGMTYGLAKIGYGLGIELPCNVLNKLTGGRLGGIGSVVGSGVAGAGGLFAGAAWVATRPWHAVDTLIGAAVSTINLLHNTSFIGGTKPLLGPISSSIPRISPLHVILATVLFFSLTRGSSQPINKPTIIDQCRQDRARVQFENNKKNKKLFK